MLSTERNPSLMLLDGNLHPGAILEHHRFRRNLIDLSPVRQQVPSVA